MSPQKIVVVGGSAAGPKTASRVRRLMPDAEVTMIQKGKNLSMASCGFPYYVSDFFDDHAALTRPSEAFEMVKDIRVMIETEVVSIDRENKTVLCREVNSGDESTVVYDKLILTTGATPNRPPIENLDADGVTTLASVEDTDYLRAVCDEKKAEKAVVIGGGLIGLETCESLVDRGIDVTVVEFLPRIMAVMDEEMSLLVENHLKAKGVKVITGKAVNEVLTDDKGNVKGVKLNDESTLECQVVVLAAGFKPNGELAASAGLEVGARGGVIVDEFMTTSDPDIYASGDCVELINLLNGQRTPAFYGDLANLEGRVAATNIAQGNTMKFPGTWMTGIAKVFDFTVGSTGLSSRLAAETYDDIETVLYAGPDKPGFMGPAMVFIKMIADKKTRNVLGVQCIGPGDVSRRISTAAMALHGGLTVDDLCVADLPYAPPYSPAIDPLITAAHILQNKMDGLMQSISPVEFKQKLDAGEDMWLLDVRTPEECGEMCLGRGETLIPIQTIRKSLDQLPEDKATPIMVYCKISLRGHEAARFLAGQGYTNATVIEGGLASWPYEKKT